MRYEEKLKRGEGNKLARRCWEKMKKGKGKNILRKKEERKKFYGKAMRNVMK